MSTDPIIEAIGEAINYGIGDANILLDCDLEDWPIYLAITSAAANARRKEQKALADYTASVTANKLSPGLGQLVKGMLKALAKSGRG